MTCCRASCFNLLGFLPAPRLSSVTEHHAGLRGAIKKKNLLRILVRWNDSVQAVMVSPGEVTWDWLEDMLRCGHIEKVELVTSLGKVHLAYPSMLLANDGITL